jgi:hypothetical protein
MREEGVRRMVSFSYTWKSDDIEFDAHGRLVIKNPQLGELVSNTLKSHNPLVIRIMPWRGQKVQKWDKLEPPEDIGGSMRLQQPIKGVVNYWAGSDCPPPAGPGDGCRIPPDPENLGCGCDIRIDRNCP